MPGGECVVVSASQTYILATAKLPNGRDKRAPQFIKCTPLRGWRRLGNTRGVIPVASHPRRDTVSDPAAMWKRHAKSGYIL